MPALIATAVLIAAAYLIGSVSFAVVVSRMMGLADPRAHGSGNPGATNVLRTGNKPAAILTLLGDMAKGGFAMWLAMRLAPRFGVSDAGLAWVAVAVFLGHLYPIFFRFAGGKGVATAAGILLALNPWLGLATLATWIVIAACLRYSSLAALASALLAPLYGALLFGPDWRAGAITAISILLIMRHRANIARLLRGQEDRIGNKTVR